MLNRDNVLRVIDNLVEALQRLRQAIEDQDSQTLQKLLEQARTSRNDWLSQRKTAKWDTTFDKVSMPTAKETLGRLIGWRDRSKDRKSP